MILAGFERKSSAWYVKPAEDKAFNSFHVFRYGVVVCLMYCPSNMLYLYILILIDKYTHLQPLCVCAHHLLL